MIIKIIAGVVTVLIVGVLIFASTKPDTFRVKRTARIKAPPEKIYALIEDFHQWISWSPYENRDPAMKKTYSGAPLGKGAVYAWDGNKDAGAGRIEITDVTVPTKVTMLLEFTRPFATHNIVDFTIMPDGEATEVSWDMHGPAPFLSKLMQVFFNMDKMVGKDFEDGLAAMRTVAER